MSGRIANRAAFTLYEVVLALAILLGAMAVLSEMVATGSRAANRAHRRTEAVLLCQSKLAKVVAGVEPMIPVDRVPCDQTAPEWVWSLSVLPGPLEELLELQVSVAHLADLPAGGPTVTMTRYIRDPELFEEAASQKAVSGEPSVAEE